MRGLLAVVAIVTLTLAGCTAPTGSGAKPLLDEADALAQEWQPDAVLVKVYAVELRNGTDYSATENGPADPSVLSGYDDPVPGDGRAPAWMFSYQSPSADEGLDMILSPSGKLLQSNPQNKTKDTPIDRDGWSLDAEEAWRSAREGNASFREVAANAWLGFQALTMFPGYDNPLWILGASTGESSDDLSMILVDARDGTLHSFDSLLHEILKGLMPVFREFGDDWDILTPTSSSREYTFEVQNGYHDILALSLGAGEATPPTQTVTAIVTGPEGWNATFSHTRGVEPLDTPEVHIVADPLPGNYTVTFVLDPLGPSGLAAAFEFSWCTDGIWFAAMAPFTPDACDHVG